MLQILDEGRLTDSQGTIVDFKNTIIVLTSNLGSEVVLNQTEDDAMGFIKEAVMQQVRATFKPEFLNRLDEIILFHKLTNDNIRHIVGVQLEDLKKILLQQNINLELDDLALEYLSTKGYDPMFGARPLKRLIQRELQNSFAKLILAGEVSSGRTILVSADKNALKFQIL